jgi:hypothetical protein
MTYSKFLIGVAAAAIMTTTGAVAKASEHAHCKLTNVSANKVLFDGICVVSQEQSGKNTIYSVKMSGGESFMFAGHGSEWMHGAEKVNFTNLPNGGIFKWSNFALVVAE